jgi:ankyrin repeat protein
LLHADSIGITPIYFELIGQAYGFFSRHHKTHSKPYRCSHCSVGFALRNDLDRHKAKHGARVDTKFYCNWPGCHFKGALRKDNLLKHIRKAHKGENITEQEDIHAEVRIVYEKGLKQQKTATERLGLMKAVQSGNISMVMLLLRNGADIGEINDRGQTSLHVATLNGDLEMAQVLLDIGIDIEAKDNNNRTAFYHAARTGNEAIFRILLQQNASPSIIERNKEGNTVLHDASSSGNEGIVRLLVDQLVELDASVDTLDNNQRTALYRAALNGNSAVVAILLAAGADNHGGPKSSSSADQRKNHYMSALRAAVRRDHEAVIHVLLAAGSKPTSLDLYWAIDRGHENIVEKLVAAGADVNTAPRGPVKRTPLQEAILRGHEKIVEMLVAAGANFNTTSSWDSRTPLQIAIEEGYGAIVEKLLAAGADA